MCVAMVIIYKKTLEKKGVDDVASKRLDLGPFQAQTMSQGTTLFSCGLMETSRWPEVRRGCALQQQQQRPVGASLESLWDVLPCTEVHHHQSPARAPWGLETAAMVPPGAITTLLQDLSLAEAAAATASPSTAPPSKRQCRSLSCSDELGGCRSSSAWRPQGSRVWTTVEKRRCHSGGSVQRPGLGFPAMQRSSSFSLPARSNTLEPHGFGQRPSACPAASSSAFTSLTASSMVSLFPSEPQTLYLSHERICLPSPASSPDSTPELERRGGPEGGLARSRSQPCVLNDKKIGMKRRRPADTHKQRPSLDLAKMTQKLRSFHSLSCPGITDREDGCPSSHQATAATLRSAGGQRETSDFSSVSEQGAEDAVLPTKEDGEDGSEVATEDPTIEELDDWGSSVGYDVGDTVSSSNGKAREPLWAGLCSTRKDMYQLGGELDIDQIERN